MMRLSIITVNYNNIQGLKTTLESVISQDSHQFEHIIIDAASTDGSVDVIANYAVLNGSCEDMKSVDNRRVVWLSEPDSGIYEGMNKGVSLATGDYVYFLNSGDLFADNTTIRKMIDQLSEADILLGRVILQKNGLTVGNTAVLEEADLSLFHMFLRGINHQSALIKRELLVKSPYNTALKINADWAFFVEKIVLENAKVVFTSMVFAIFDMDGVSSRNIEKQKEERKNALSLIVPDRIAKDYLSIAPFYYEIYRIQWLLRHPIFYRFYKMLCSIGIKLLGK